MTESRPTVAAALSEAAERERPSNVIFAAPADDPRSRRPVDVFEFVVALLVLVLAGLTHRAPADVDQRALDFVADGLPDWISFVLTVAFVLGGLYPIGLIVGVLLFARDRRALSRDMVLAGALAIGLATLGAFVIDRGWPDFFPEVVSREGRPSYPVVRLAFSVAVVSMARPYLSLSMRRLGRRLLLAMALAALALGFGTISALCGGVAGGVMAATVVRLVLGSGAGIPSRHRLRDALRVIGLEPVSIDYLPEQPIGATLIRARLDDGADVLVKVYGRDAADAAAASRLWRRVWYRGTNRALTATGLQQVEHESLMLLEGARAGAPVPELISWGRGDSGDAIVVTRWLEAPRLHHLTGDEIDERRLDQCWEALARLHGANIAHREIDRLRIVLLEDEVVLDDLSGSLHTPDDITVMSDVAQMLVATAAAVGSDRAVVAARRNLGDQRLAATLPLLQHAALPPSLQRDAKGAGVNVNDLRAVVTEVTGVDEGDLIQLARVTASNLAMVVLTFVAGYALISALADIGFETIVDELSNASWEWVLVALVLAQLTNIGEYISLTGMIDREVPFGPTVLFRYALSFISLAVPSEAGAIAMNIRYMQKLGVAAAAAAAQGPMLTIFSKAVDILLLLVASRVIEQNVDLDDLDSGPVLRLLVLIAVAVVVGTVATVAVPKLRAQVVPPIRTALRAFRASVSNPERLGRIVGGTIVQRVLAVLALSASVSAYGQSLSFGEAVFVNSAVSLVVGLMPVPGGIGVGEAAFTAGLTAVGVPEGPALAAAITHRLMTNYLPPVVGFFSTRWLTERDYL